MLAPDAIEDMSQSSRGGEGEAKKSSSKPFCDVCLIPTMHVGFCQLREPPQSDAVNVYD